MLGTVMRKQVAILGMIVVLAGTGCAVWKKDKQGAKSKESWFSSKVFKKEYQKPGSMAAIWSPDILSMTGKPPTRGFGGRVYFYNAKSQAVPVDGELVVYGYARKEHKSEEQVEADKTFRFTAEQLTEHFSPSELGASYSVWIPWDAANGLRQEITLIPAFKEKNGSVIQGAAAKLYLPGRAGFASDEDSQDPPTQTVSYRKSSMPTNPGVELPKFEKLRAEQSQMRTTTINVPDNATFIQPKRASRDTFTLGATGNGAGLPSAAQFAPLNQQGLGQQGAAQRGYDNLQGTPALPENFRSGANGASSLKAPSASPNNYQQEMAPVSPLQATPNLTPQDIKELSPPSRKFNLGSPIAHQPYSMMNQEVQAAGFIR